VTGWHGLDLAMLAVLALSVLVGLWRGLVYELMSLAGWVVAYIASIALARHIGPYLPIGEPGSALNTAAAVIVGFMGVLIVWGLLARLARFLIAATPLTVVDRILGAAFGLLRGLLILLVVVTVIGLTPTAKSPWWQASRGVQWLGVVVEGLRPLLPADITRWLPAMRASTPPGP
jgi:membrane protein required for colicin V production